MKYMFLIASILSVAFAAGNCPDFPSCHCPGDLCRIGSGTPGDGVCCEGKTCVQQSGSENWVCFPLNGALFENKNTDTLGFSTASRWF